MQHNQYIFIELSQNDLEQILYELESNCKLQKIQTSSAERKYFVNFFVFHYVNIVNRSPETENAEIFIQTFHKIHLFLRLTEIKLSWAFLLKGRLDEFQVELTKDSLIKNREIADEKFVEIVKPLIDLINGNEERIILHIGKEEYFKLVLDILGLSTDSLI